MFLCFLARSEARGLAPTLTYVLYSNPSHERIGGHHETGMLDLVIAFRALCDGDLDHDTSVLWDARLITCAYTAAPASTLSDQVLSVPSSSASHAAASLSPRYLHRPLPPCIRAGCFRRAEAEACIPGRYSSFLTEHEVHRRSRVTSHVFAR